MNVHQINKPRNNEVLYPYPPILLSVTGGLTRVPIPILPSTAGGLTRVPTPTHLAHVSLVV